MFVSFVEITISDYSRSQFATLSTPLYTNTLEALQACHLSMSDVGLQTAYWLLSFASCI